MTKDLDLFFGTSGPRDARIMLVGEAWGGEESAARRPFVGPIGSILRKIIEDANLDIESFFLTNVVPTQPFNNDMWRLFDPAKGNLTPAFRGLHPLPTVMQGLETLWEQVRSVNPDLIIACGNYALWALTLHTDFSTTQASMGRRVPSGIMKWRGSMIYANGVPGKEETLLLPIIHPGAIRLSWYQRPITVHDLRLRVPKALANDWRRPHQTVLAPPIYEEAIEHLDTWLSGADQGPLRLAHDIETARGLITCMGFADSENSAMTIPFINFEGKQFISYWTAEQEWEIIRRARKLLSHKNCLVEGQNYLYDTQYLQRYLAVTPNLDFDTMWAWHLLFPGTPKGLDYLSSVHCEYHWYWKDDNKEWDLKGDLKQHLEYNSEDCMRTFEVATAERTLIPDMNLGDQWEEQKALGKLALRMMNRGVRCDREHRAQLALELSTASSTLGHWFESILPQEIVKPGAKTPWYQSVTQQRDFFSDELGLDLPRHHKTKRPTFGKNALDILTDRHPEFSRIFTNLRHFRSLRTYNSNFIKAPLDVDDRMRSFYGKTETFRWTSSKNAFGSGTNFQNIPEGTEDD